jgi:NAD(P)-dependent dehydrogenase (short-subunit alcohol dehydrogenase family)
VVLTPEASLLTDKVAVVTGGAGGIGRGISEAFAAHGAKVVVVDIDDARARDAVEAISARDGGDARAEVVDVREPDQVSMLAESVLEAYGRVDILVNNVGHYLFRGLRFLDTDDEHWDALYAVNLRHVFLCTRAFAPSMVERGTGNIITVSTVEAFRGIPNQVVYSAFKAGITQFTKSLALDLGNDGVRVNAIAPDLTETIQVPYSRWVPPEQHDLIPTWVPVGRFGTPDDIAGVAVFLASDLSAFVTGSTVNADGGSLAAGGWYRTKRGGWTNRPVDP